MSPKRSDVTLRLLFAERGTFHDETVTVPAAALEGYDRLIDALRESPEVTRRVAVNPKRLVSVQIVDGA